MEVQNYTEELTAKTDDNNALLKPPWSPALIATVTILFSVLPAGIFHALNYERLGLQELKASSLKTNILLFIFAMLAARLIKPDLISAIFQLVFHIGCAKYFYNSQSQLYKKHVSIYKTKASGLYMFIISLAIYLLLIIVLFGMSFIFEI